MNRYLFVHIPKAAGVKVRHNIHMNADYPHGQLCVQEDGWDFRVMSDVELQSFALVAGHIGFAIRKRFEIDRRVVVVLREPLDRIVSLYHYWRTLDGAPIAGLANSLSLEEFVVSNDQLVVEHIDNAQTWQLFEDFATASRRRYASVSDDELVARAVQNLESIDVVGIQEDLVSTMALMKATFAWPFTDDAAQKVNATPEYALDVAARDRLRELAAPRVRLDNRVYAAAKAIFVRRCDSHGIVPTV